MTDTPKETMTDVLEPTSLEEHKEESPHNDLEKFKDLWMRAVADTENLRKRSAKDKEDAVRYGITKFAQDMISVADNLSRALETCPPHPTDDMKGMVEGLKLVQEELHHIFERHGIHEIQPLGETFDPNFHQAMFEIPQTENYTAGQVGQVLQKGYMIYDRLLRPALVGVAK